MSFDDGLAPGAGVVGAGVVGAAMRVDDVDVYASTNAGNYYCGHLFYLLSRWALQADGRGAGFLHVPADRWTTGAPAAPATDRHARTRVVIAAALRGIADAGVHQRVLVTGYGAFSGVVDNPTGAFVASSQQLSAALSRSVGAARVGSDTDAGLPTLHAGGLTVARMQLAVDDTALHAHAPGSLAAALSAFEPHAVIAMGVHRADANYRVEQTPTSAGLRTHAVAPSHSHDDVGACDVLPDNTWLLQAIARGAAALRTGPRPRWS